MPCYKEITEIDKILKILCKINERSICLCIIHKAIEGNLFTESYLVPMISAISHLHITS